LTSASTVEADLDLLQPCPLPLRHGSAEPGKAYAAPGYLFIGLWTALAGVALI
jgi:hypothetical protein